MLTPVCLVGAKLVDPTGVDIPLSVPWPHFNLEVPHLQDHQVHLPDLQGFQVQQVQVHLVNSHQPQLFNILLHIKDFINLLVHLFVQLLQEAQRQQHRQHPEWAGQRWAGQWQLRPLPQPQCSQLWSHR